LPRFAADGLELAYETYGDGEPVVLLHGFTSVGSTWVHNGWVDALVAAGLRAVTLDFPGHGASDAPRDDDQCAPLRLAHDVVELLDHLDVSRALLVGFSMGAGVALQVDRTRVAALVVGGIGDAALHEMAPDVLTASERVRRNAALAGNDFDVLRAYLRGGRWPGGLVDISHVRVPTLLFAAERDEYMRGHSTLVELLRPTRVLDVPGRGHHDVLLDEAVRREAVEFLRESA
jgi:pimeloyl-ACP methyl ester carboxylesterase